MYLSVFFLLTSNTTCPPGMSHPPIRIELPELAVQQPLAWRLVTDIEQLGGTILLVLVHRPIAGAGVGDSVPYMDRIITMEPGIAS